MKKRVRTNDKTTFREVLELYRLEEKFKAYKKSYEQARKELTTSISNYMFSNNFGVFDFRSREFGAVKVNKIARKTIEWDVEKLRDSLGKELFDAVTTKQYTIADMEGLVKYLKSCGVSPKKFKSFLQVETKVIDSEVNQLSEIGDIKAGQLEGCYKLKEASPYLRIDVKAIEEEDNGE